MNLKNALKNAAELLDKNIDKLDIILVAHVLAPRGYDNPLQTNCSETEHFTLQEFNDIYQGIVNAGFYIRKVHFSEFEFIQEIFQAPDKYANTVVMNLCRNGIGMNKKVAIPAICDLLGIKYTSSGSAQCAIARNKWLYTSLLSSNGINCPITGFKGNELSKKLHNSTMVICKPNHESASQGVDENSIMKLKEAIDYTSEDILIKEFIDGYECEVPIFSSKGQCFALPPVGIRFNSKMNSQILSDTVSKANDYGFFPLNQILSDEICSKIMTDAISVFKLLGLEKYGRIDFRINKKNNMHYVIDISTTPYITKHSSLAYAVEYAGGSYNDIYKLIIASVLSQ